MQAGIVHDSDSDSDSDFDFDFASEREETTNKGRALFRAVAQVAKGADSRRS